MTTLDTMCGTKDYPGTVKWTLIATLYQSFDPDATEEVLSAAVALGAPTPFEVVPYKSPADLGRPTRRSPAWSSRSPTRRSTATPATRRTVEIEWSMDGRADQDHRPRLVAGDRPRRRQDPRHPRARRRPRAPRAEHRNERPARRRPARRRAGRQSRSSGRVPRRSGALAGSVDVVHRGPVVERRDGRRPRLRQVDRIRRLPAAASRPAAATSTRPPSAPSARSRSSARTPSASRSRG